MRFVAFNKGFWFALIGGIIFFVTGCHKKETSEPPGFCEQIVDQFGDSVRCGNLLVAENHHVQNGKSISIAYVVIQAKLKSEKPPVLFLNGGPGSKSLTQISRWLKSPFREEHDIILFDQRGIGHSSPLPDVGPEMVDIIASDLSSADEAPLVKEALSEVSAVMRNQGIDAASYNVFQSAKDVSLLMQHLRYDKYRLLGVSYGTKLGQLVAQDNPDKIESLVLYGPAAVFVDFYGTVIPYFENSLAKLSPNVLSEFSDAVNNTINEPILIQHLKKNYHLNPQDILMVARYILYRPDGASVFPRFTQALNRRDTAQIREISAGPLTTILGSNFTLYLSSMLYDEYRQRSEQDYSLTVKNSQTKHGFALINSYIKSLPLLHDGRASEAEMTPGQIDIPTLILVNRFDPATPTDNVKRVLKQLPKARLMEFERGGHIVWDSLSYTTVLSFWNEMDRE